MLVSNTHALVFYTVKHFNVSNELICCYFILTKACKMYLCNIFDTEKAFKRDKCNDVLVFDTDKLKCLSAPNTNTNINILY